MWSSARRAADAALSRAWGIGLAMSGWLRSPVARWARANGPVMVVAPHPDDEVASAGGAILLHRRAGDAVTIVHVTDGRGSRAQGLGPDAMAARRREEAAAAMPHLGGPRWEWLGLREWEWKDDGLVAVLSRLIAESKPRVIYAPSRVDFHPEHRRVAAALSVVLARVPDPAPLVRIYQVQVPLTRVLTNVVAPLSEVAADLERATGAYATQQDSLRACLRLKVYAGRSHGVVGGAEEFWEVSAGTFVALHAGEESAGQTGLRGLRRLSLSDPLAFLVGRAERIRLRGRAQSRRTDA